MPAEGEDFGVAGGPDFFVTGYRLGLALGIATGAPVAMNGEQGLPLTISALEGTELRGDEIKERFVQAVVAILPGDASLRAIDQDKPVSRLVPEIVLGAECFARAAEPCFSARFSDAVTGI